MSSSSSSSSVRPIVLDPFCFRQFSPRGHPTLLCEPDELMDRVNKAFNENPIDSLKPGYASFCKHIFIPNYMPELYSSYIPIDSNTNGTGNEIHLKSKYEARRESELPVLVRYFEKSNSNITIPTAKYLDIILYSREQIEIENAAISSTESVDEENLDGHKLSSEYRGKLGDSRWLWGVISVKPQLENFETPMTPMTMMRNALGISEGGSGIAIDREKYMESVKFWSKNALVA